MQNLGKPEVRLGEWISEGWKMFTEQWKAWVINTLIFLGIAGVPVLAVIIGFYAYLITTLTSASPGRPPDIAPESILVFYAIFFAVWAFAMVASCFFLGGMHQSAIKQLQGGKIEVRDLFSGAKYFFPVLGATLLTMILTMIGAMLCIVPAFLVAGCLFFTMPLIVHRRLGVIEAMKTSYELTKQNIWMFALFAFVVQLLSQAGAYALYVGLLATVPLLFTISAVAYRDTFGVEGARFFRPVAPPAHGYPQPYGAAYPAPWPPDQPGDYGQPPVGNYQKPVGESSPGYFDQSPPAAPENQPGGLGDSIDKSPALTAPQPSPTEQIVPPVTDEITPAPAGLVCPQCQTALPPTAAFCPRCGTRVG